MKTLIINTHLSYPGWSERKLNFTFMDLAKTFFIERGHEVAETFVERGYNPEEEVKKHVAAMAKGQSRSMCLSNWPRMRST